MSTVVKDRYGCFDRPPVDKTPPYIAQDGWIDGKRKEVVVRTQWDGEGCKADRSARVEDPKCAGCHWRYRA